MAESLYCALAFNSVSFGNHGGSRPCCAVDTYFWQEVKHVLPDYNNDIIQWINNKDLVKLRQDMLEGKWNPICNLCKVREEHGQPSTRQIFNNTLSDVAKKTDRNWIESEAVLKDLSNIFLLDITVGNKCNSACLMCNPSASNVWAQEQEEILNQKFHWLMPSWFNEKNALMLIDKMPNLRAIQFVGGEPTINDDHISMLKKLIDDGRAPNITLGYVTNLTNISAELIELWSHFSTKHITISVDGVGPVNEYIRYPFKWEKVSRQLEIIKENAKLKGDYFIGLSHTVISLNILTLDSLLDWWEDQVLSSDTIQKTLPHIQLVNNPAYFDPAYVPINMKKDVESMCQRLERRMAERNLADKYASVISNIRSTVVNSTIDEEEQKIMWFKMQDFCTKLDKHRNRNIFDYLPFMKKYWVIV